MRAVESAYSTQIEELEQHAAQWAALADEATKLGNKERAFNALKRKAQAEEQIEIFKARQGSGASIKDGSPPRTFKLSRRAITILASLFLVSILTLLHASREAQREDTQAAEAAAEQREARRAEAETKRNATDAGDGCGPRPKPDGWDGGILEIEVAVERTAHDPGSIDVERCTQPVKTERCWETRCDVRGKNALGAKVLESKRFAMANGRVTILE